MKQLKFVIAGLGILGVIAIFLPLASGVDMKLWDLKSVKAVWVYPPLLGFLAAAVMGGLASVQGALLQWQAAVAAAGFAITFVSKPVREGMTDGGAIGAKLLFLSAVLGVVAAIVAVAKSDKA